MSAGVTPFDSFSMQFGKDSFPIRGDIAETSFLSVKHGLFPLRWDKADKIGLYSPSAGVMLIKEKELRKLKIIAYPHTWG